MTGVQTCALPIYQGNASDHNEPGKCKKDATALLPTIGNWHVLPVVLFFRLIILWYKCGGGMRDDGGSGVMDGGGERFRSEERRVGKECRSRWSQYH